jgi:hypothetical protein
MRLALAALTALACYTAPPWEPPGPGDLDPAWVDCSGGEACVIVELGCCDHCNGGAAVSVVASAADAAREAFAERCRGDVACTLIGCPDLEPVCEAGVCGAVAGEL